MDDQREASGRPDVVAFVSDTLTAPVKISGQPVANLIASTSGTDSDWVVKLIDVYPDEVAGQAAMGGYQLMISADIFRGRYRESLETAKPIAAGKPLLYRFELPTANHVFLPGPPNHGADSVELVPALRPQPADFRAEHLLGQAWGLPEGGAACLSRKWRGQLHPVASGHDALTGSQHSARLPCLVWVGHSCPTLLTLISNVPPETKTNSKASDKSVRPTLLGSWIANQVRG